MRAWVAIAALIMVILAIEVLPRAFSMNCPKNTYGTGEKVVKYFSSPLCVACWVQKPIIEEIAAEGQVKFEEYDSDFCGQHASPHSVRGVPAFIVGDKINYGLHDEQALRKAIA